MEQVTVMLLLCRRVIVKLLREHIENSTGFDTITVYKPNEVARMALARKPRLAVVEIPERCGSPALETLDVCRDLKAASPNCKIMLMCPEQDQESVAVCEAAMKDGEVEDYVFFETSPEYLTSKLKTMLDA